MRPANARRRCIVKSSLIGWVHTQNYPSITCRRMHYSVANTTYDVSHNRQVDSFFNSLFKLTTRKYQSLVTGGFPSNVSLTNSESIIKSWRHHIKSYSLHYIGNSDVHAVFLSPNINPSSLVYTILKIIKWALNSPFSPWVYISVRRGLFPCISARN